MYNLNNLSQQEKDDLLQQLVTKYDGGDQGGAPAGDDSQQDADQMEPFAKVLEILIDKVEAQEEKICKLESLVIDDLFGGIQKMYDTNMRTKSIDDLKGKYGGMFDPHMATIQELEPDGDLYGMLHDMISPMRDQEGWNDEQEAGTVKSVADAIAEKIAKIKGAGAPAPDAAGPDGVAVEVTKTSAAPVSGGADENFLNKVRKMKQDATSKNVKEF